MLSLYGSITVPEVPDVVVYRDDEDPKKFYMVSGKPKILRSDPRNPASAPMLDMLTYVRDFSGGTFDEADIERGHLQMTVGLEVAQADQDKIRTHLRAKIAEESTSGYRFLGIPVRMAEPELSYAPLFVNGEGVATSFAEDLQIASQSTSPAMNSGTNAVSFSYALTQSGARVLNQAMQQGALPIQVAYRNLGMVARIPSITIRIHGDRSEFLSEVRNNSIMRGYVSFGGLIIHHLVWYMPPTLSTFRQTIQSLTIEIDDGDFRDADPSDDLSAELETMAMTVLQNNILPSFFEQAIPAQDESEEEDGNGWWLPDEGTTVTGSIDMTISRRDVVTISHGANGLIGPSISEADAKAAVRVADANLANIPVQKLTVLANVNFQIDPIFSVRVLVDYDQFDDRRQMRVRNQHEVLFQQDAKPVQKPFVLATDADGAPKYDYRYRAVVNFKGTDRVVEYPPNGGWQTRQGEYLVISYGEIGHVKVDLVLAPMPAEVDSVDVTVRYPDQTLIGAVQTISLSKAKPTASWLVNTGSTAPIAPYEITKTYRLNDGSTIVTPPEQATATSYTVTSPFEFRSTTTFVARGDFERDIATILVTPSYEDAAHQLTARTTLTLDNTHRTATWSVSQADKDKRAFTYTVRVLRQNGSEQTTTAQGLLGEVITVGPSGSDALEVIVDAELVDWMKFTRLLVTLTYSDPDNGVNLTKPMLFTDTGGKQQTWTALIADPTKRTLSYAVRRIGRVASDDAVDTVMTTDLPFIVLR